MLYVIQGIGTDSYKIGFSNSSPEDRLEALQTGNPVLMRTIALFDGTREDEAKVHHMLKQRGFHMRSEWFEIRLADLFHILFEVALEREMKFRSVNIYSQKAVNKLFEEKYLEDWLDQEWVMSKDTPTKDMVFNTTFDQVWTEYYAKCFLEGVALVRSDFLMNKLNELKVGRLIHDNKYIFNMRKK
jgi:hypothetical protein